MQESAIDVYLLEDIKSFLQRFRSCDVENKIELYYLQAEVADLLTNIENR
jgi:hypothetical protein